MKLLNMKDIIGGDKILMFIFYKNGKMKYLHEKMATYRKHMSGISYIPDNEKKYCDMIRTYKVVNKYFNYRYSQILRKDIYVSYSNLALFYRNKGKLIKALKYTFIALLSIRNRGDLKIFISDILLKLFKKQA